MADTGSGEDLRTSIAARTLSVISEADEPRPAPAVTLSWAQSRDGAIAAAGSVRIPLSCPESLVLTHTLRAMHAAILVGIDTILADGPQPQPVVLDSRLRFPLSARLLARTDRTPWIFHAEPDSGETGGFARKIRELKARGARLFAVGRTADGLDLEEVLSVLARQVVITVCPFTLDGLRVLEQAAGPERLPGLVDEIREVHGRDTVVWGRVPSP